MITYTWLLVLLVSGEQLFKPCRVQNLRAVTYVHLLFQELASCAEGQTTHINSLVSSQVTSPHAAWSFECVP